ncbi:BHLH domain-containing protein [Favolaschia claudopus]|uniref:BHLH domain-containing protein n=1 Tax=Favolaschia claudopus TaxID=2862362 RepID=A0AAW0B3J4_9AGAR
MALTISPPSPASSSTSDSSSSASTGPPQTPVLSSDLPLTTPTAKATTDSSSPTTTTGAGNAGGVKRTTKPSRRANTAERRATHNAVERQRRETLNGRFLDLAAMLPNLSQIRRPSKSAIVNSSIAHINASRRHRILAAQQLRLMKNETDALRHEVNEWRVRAGVPCVEEPRRGDGFAVVLSGELEFEEGDMVGGEEGEEEDGGLYGGGQYGGYEDAEEIVHLQHQQQRQQQVDLMAQQQQSQHFVGPEVVHPHPHTQPMTIAIGPSHPSHPHARQQSHSPPHFGPHSPPHFGGQQQQAPSPPQYGGGPQPMIASPTSMIASPTFVGDAAYEHHHQLMMQHHQQLREENEKWVYQQQVRARQAQGAW